MRNVVRFNSQRLPNSIKSGDFNIGVDNDSIDLTGFYNGLTPIIGGYTIYINKTSNGPSIYTPKNDSELIQITNSLGADVSTATNALTWINSQSNMTVVNTNYPPIVTDGLVLNIDAGLVSSYPKTGTAWRDLSGNGNNGTLVNGPTFDSENGGSIVFDGVDDYISIQSSLDSLNGTTEASLVMWVKLSSGSNSSGLSGIIQLSGFNNGNGNLYFYTDSARVGGIWLDIFRTNRVFTGDWSPTFNATNYHMLTVTTTPGTNGWKMYLNNVLRYQTIGQNTVSVNSSIQGGLNIGRNSGSRELRGNISITTIYNRALTPQEVQQNYQAGLQRFIPTNGLVLSLDAQNTNLYATSPTTAYDVSGEGNNGTMLNGVQYVGDGGGSWKFDGVNDFINVPNSSSLQVTGDQTLVFWVYPERRDRRQNFYNKAYGGEGTITYEPGGSLNYYWGTNGGNSSPYQGVGTTGSPMATLNTWYFVVLVRELSTPSRTVKWYIDGVLNRTVSASYTSATAGSAPITIGTGYTNRFLGKVGLVYQYNTALTQDEITTIYNATKSRYGIQ